MAKFSGTSKIEEFKPLSLKERESLIAQLNEDMKNHPISQRAFKEEKCARIGVNIATFESWLNMKKNLGIKKLEQIETRLAESYEACSLMYIETANELNEFLSNLDFFILEASWETDKFDDGLKLKIEDVVNAIQVLMSGLNRNSDQVGLMERINQSIEGNSLTTSFMNDCESSGITIFGTFIPKFMHNQSGRKDISVTDNIGLICINAIPLELLTTRKGLKPSNIIFKPKWNAITKVGS